MRGHQRVTDCSCSNPQHAFLSFLCVFKLTRKLRHNDGLEELCSRSRRKKGNAACRSSWTKPKVTCGSQCAEPCHDIGFQRRVACGIDTYTSVCASDLDHRRCRLRPEPVARLWPYNSTAWFTCLPPLSRIIRGSDACLLRLTRQHAKYGAGEAFATFVSLPRISMVYHAAARIQNRGAVVERGTVVTLRYSSESTLNSVRASSRQRHFHSGQTLFVVHSGRSHNQCNDTFIRMMRTSTYATLRSSRPNRKPDCRVTAGYPIGINPAYIYCLGQQFMPDVRQFIKSGKSRMCLPRCLLSAVCCRGHWLTW